MKPLTDARLKRLIQYGDPELAQLAKALLRARREMKESIWNHSEDCHCWHCKKAGLA